MIHYIAADDCKEAQKYLENLYNDPMTEHYGCGGDVSQGYLRKHVGTCEKCRKATTEGNMP